LNVSGKFVIITKDKEVFIYCMRLKSFMVI